MPKRPCTQRAEWRLVPGKAAQRLSAHYRLDCDYGTPLIAIFKESDGSEPIYLCQAHVAEVEPSASVMSAKDQLRDAPRPDAPQPDRRDRAQRLRDTRTPTTAQRIAAEPAEPVQAKLNRVRPEPADKQSEGADRGSAPAADEIDSAVAARVAHTIRPSTLSRAPKDSLRARFRDLTYGDSAKALVDEAIWNLAPGDLDVYRVALQEGKPRIEAAQCAGGQLAIIVRKIIEHEQTLDALLSQSNATISVVEIIHKPLEGVMLDLIGNSEFPEAEKDAAVGQLGALEESLNRGLPPEITPLQALQIARGVGERANWAASVHVRDVLKPAYSAVYATLKNAVMAAVPEAASLWERLVNLYVAKAELENTHPPGPPHNSEIVSATARF